MFVDGRSIRLRIYTDETNVSEANAADVLTKEFSEKHTRPLTRREVKGLACWEAARVWADRATVSPETAYRRLSGGANIPIRPNESDMPGGLSFEGAVDLTLSILPQAACFYCGAPAGLNEIETDHAIPILRGGADRHENRLPACRPCNQAKYDRTYEGFRAYMAGRHDLDTLPTFFGETDIARRLMKYEFDPNALPDRLPSRPTSRREQATANLIDDTPDVGL